MNVRFIKISTAILLSLFIISSCDKKENSTVKNAETIIPVRVIKVEKGKIENTVKYLGNIEAFQEVKVYSTIPTKITQINVDVNDIVRKGDVMAVVDNKKIKQAVLQAEAGLESAKARYENVNSEWKRSEKLYKENAINQSQFDATKTQKETAKATVNQLIAGLTSAKEQLNDTYIKAPISGIVSMRNFNFGDQTSPQMPVFIIVKMNQVKIKINIVENQVGIVKEGQIAHVRVNSYPEKVFEGKVSKVYPTLNPMTRTALSEIIVDNEDLKLKPGMYANVEIVTDTHDNVLLVPKYAIIENTNLEYLGGELRNTKINVDKYLFIIEDSIASKIKIITGIENSDFIEVTDGVQKNDEVVTMGQYQLSDSSKVYIVNKGK